MPDVLIVDDDPSNRQLLVRQVTGMGLQACDVDSLAAVRAWLESGHRCRVALLDYYLDGALGTAVLRLLREVMPGLPAVFVTVAWSGAALADMAAAQATLLGKPYRRGALVAALSAAGVTATGEPR